VDSTTVLTAMNLGLQAQLAVAKQTIAAQQSLTTVSITVLALVVAALAGATWLWNFVFNKRLLSNQIEKAKMDITAHSRSLIEAEVTKSLVTVKAELDQKVLAGTAEQARLFAYACMDREQWQAACGHLGQAVTLYAATDYPDLLRTAVDVLVSNLDRCTWLGSPYRDCVNEALKSIPPLLTQERESIKKLLCNLPDKETPVSPAVPAAKP